MSERCLLPILFWKCPIHNHLAIQKVMLTFLITSVNYDWQVHRTASTLHLTPHCEMRWRKLWNIQMHSQGLIRQNVHSLYVPWQGNISEHTHKIFCKINNNNNNNNNKTKKDFLAKFVHNKEYLAKLGVLWSLFVKVKVRQSRYRPGVAQRIPGSLGSQISWQRHKIVVRLSALCTGCLYPRKCSWCSFLLEAESTPGPYCDRKDFYVNKKFQ